MGPGSTACRSSASFSQVLLQNIARCDGREAEEGEDDGERPRGHYVSSVVPRSEAQAHPRSALRSLYVGRL